MGATMTDGLVEEKTAPDTATCDVPRRATEAAGDDGGFSECEVEVRPNPYVNSELEGNDAFEARIAERPGLSAFGPTAEAASALVQQLAVADYRVATPKRRRRLKTLQALVQFNHRITVEDATQIVSRAESVGLSVRRFMLNQLLHAEIVRPNHSAPVKVHQIMWEKTAQAAKLRVGEGSNT